MPASKALVTAHDLREHFHEAVNSAVAQHQLPLSAASSHYLGNLLADFSSTGRLFAGAGDSRGLPPLADLYAEAHAASQPRERQRALRQLGDVALMVAGVFSEYLKRRLVDIDYYVAMGGSAYAHLAGCSAEVYRELSEKFVCCMDALGEACASHAANTDVLRDYEVWLRTGSARHARRLAQHGIPVSAHATHLRLH